MKKYAKFIDENTIQEAPSIKDGNFFNYNSEANEPMLLADDYLPVVISDELVTAPRVKMKYRLEEDRIVAFWAEYPFSFDDLKAAKREEINQARDAAEQGGFEYLSKVFDSDPISCQRIALASQTALISKQASQEFSVEWTCQDNSKITLSADETIGLSVALTKWSNECHIRASKLKVMIEEAETKEEVDAINWGLDLSTEQVSEQVEEEIKEEIVSEANDVIEEID